MLINNQEVDITTVMDKSIEFIPDGNTAEKVKEDIVNLLNEYNYDVDNRDYGIQKMFNSDGIHYRNKGWLYNLFSKHPNYDGEGRIIFPETEMVRKINLSQIVIFEKWITEQINNIVRSNRLDKPISYTELKNGVQKLNNIVNLIEDCHKYRIKASYFGESIAELNKDIYRFKELIRMYLTPGYKQYWITSHEKVIISSDFYSKIEAYENSFNLIFNNVQKNHICTKELADKINALIYSYNPKLNAAEGLKLSRLVGRLCKDLGIDRVTDIQNDHQGRPKDYGYNYQFALFADAINPLSVKKTFVLSINPLDFYTMSFGNSWASCHTIDKENKRDSSNTYEGQYSSGTESYMLDDSSIIAYYREADLDEKHKYDKIKRCVFYLGEDKIIQSRVYPDGRDGGEVNIAKDMRELAQNIISNLLDIPNYWSVKSGTGPCVEVIYTQGTHHPDYQHYSDCNVSYAKRIDGFLNYKTITVGHDPICPKCGIQHSRNDNILCEDCYREDDYDGYCNCCGAGYYQDDEIWDRDTDNCYCCTECAERHDVYWCENVEEYHSENVYYDDWINEYFYDRDDEYIITDDGNCYMNELNANAAGYEYDEINGGWYREEDLVMDTYTGERFFPDGDTLYLNDDIYYSEDNAISDGWQQNEDGEWIREDDAA